MKRVAILLALTTGCAGGQSYVPGPLADRSAAPTVAGSAGKDELGDAPPPALARRRRALPAPADVRLSNGVRVLMLERHEFPTASVTFLVDRGASAAPQDVAAMYVEASRGATKDYTRKETFDFLAFLGAHTSAWHRADGVGFEVTVLSPFLSKALVPVASMFTAASFDSEDLGFARAAVRAELLADRRQPSDLASLTARRMIFGPDHPYARGGAPERLDGIGRKELEAFREANLVAERVTVVAVGDFDRAALTARLEKLLAPLPRKKAAAAPAIPAAPPPSAARITVVSRKASSQSNVAIAFPGARRGDDAHAVLRVLTVLLGRGLSGRLDLKIRGEHGFSYGVHARDLAYREGGVFMVTAAVDTPHTAESLKGLVGELARVRTEVVPAPELARAKRQALDELATEHMGGGALASLALGGLPLGYFEDTAKRIEALDAAGLRAAAEQFLVTEKAQIAIVGDDARTVEGLRAAGLGEVVVTTAPE